MHHINLTRRNTQWQSSLSPCIDPANDKLSQTTNSPFEFCRSFSGQNTWTYNATELCGLQVKVLTIISTSHSTSKRISGDMESVKNNLFNQRAAAQILWLSASSLLCESMTHYSVHIGARPAESSPPGGLGITCISWRSWQSNLKYVLTCKNKFIRN